MTPEQRAAAVAQAQAWVGTPYHHHGRIRGVGVDCLMLLAEVFEAAGIVAHVDPGTYAPQWHLHRGDELYLQGLMRYCQPLPEGAMPQAGDVGLWRFGRTFSHGGIVIEGGADPLIVHAYIGRGVIVSRASEAPLAGRPSCYWSIA